MWPKYGKIYYVVGEAFDLTDYIIILISSDGSMKNVTSSCVYTPTEELTTTDTVIIISYTENDMTYSIEQPIKVLEAPHISLSYIQSSGYEYIDTGVLPSSDTNVEIDFEYISNDTTESLYGPIAVQRYTRGSNMFGLFINNSTGQIAVNHNKTDSDGISGTNGYRSTCIQKYSE